jgi:hypothetical protein
MEILCHDTSHDAAEDTSDTSGQPREGDEVLRAMLWIFSGLDAHDGISHHIDECLSEGCHGQTGSNRHRSGAVQEVDGDEG